MKKFAIKLHNKEAAAHLIFHATPTAPSINFYSLYKHHQWYLTKDKDVVGDPITEENVPSFITTTERIKEKGYDGFYLYCKYTDIKTNKENHTEFIKLYSDVNKMIDSGTVFDDISQYDKNGAII
ncbi:hypothetical protein L1I79_37585 [Strepomyces sp. STD 3.1]|nr:hypothetical protein [Streptomyces sp. STD 3.1]